MKQYPERKSESGVALVTVLMIVAAMSAVAITLSSAVLASTSRARAIDSASQADWLVLSAEEVGRAAIGDMVTATEGKLFAGMPGLAEPTVIDVEGGRVVLTGRDGGNCFNVNTLASANTARTPGLEAAEGSPADTFESLLELAEAGDGNASGLTASLADWLDPDQSPGMSGAENAFYASASVPYRTPGQPMQSISELRSVRYFTPGVYEALEPLLCALPQEESVVLNINTLDQTQAPLLSLAFSGALTVEGAGDLIFQRPNGGWESVDIFLTEPAIREIAPALRRTDMLSVESRYVAVRAGVQFRDARRLVDILFAVDGPDSVKTLWRERKG